MSDRIKVLTVVLEQDLREEEIQPLIAAIKQLRNVIEVSAEVADPNLYVATTRVRRELGQKLLKIVFPDVYPDK